MSKDMREYLRHMLDECSYLIAAKSNLSYTEFIDDETLKRAAVRSIEIIGEAAKKISAEFRVQYPEINWKNMAGMRDKLIHDYMGINYRIVWDVIANKIPELHDQVEQIIKRS
ncbi:DUF86 domain-containing protein [Parapedobacter defluvii]|uniref:DUF86 domain-containing protein n=1 Tax=Parapedobacter defluvii TaxID=2045106 RepID=A0ABQ1LAC0_9SPHI|nr:DUF86 domain-containing protein [Parapedobacter defluvii]GGC21792.1 DUF86 domain-containing protein [Parapedobacter defluvii]